MSNRKKRFDRVPSNQPVLIDVEPENGPEDFDVALKFKSALSEALKRCKLSRYEVCAKISELTGKELTKAMMDQYTAESKEDYRFPAEQLAAFCQVTKSYKPFRVLLEPLHCNVSTPEEKKALEIYRLEKEIREKQDKLMRLKG